MQLCVLLAGRGQVVFSLRKLSSKIYKIELKVNKYKNNLFSFSFYRLTTLKTPKQGRLFKLATTDIEIFTNYNKFRNMSLIPIESLNLIRKIEINNINIWKFF